MIMLSSLFKKFVQIALVAVVALTALPVTSAYASGLNDPENPPADTTQLSDERLEQIWTRMQRIYERQERILEHADATVEKFQSIIDRLEENGRDVIALQSAIDTFEEALKETHPIYESAKGVINSHQGFDADGKVTDHESAVETVKDLGEKLREIRKIVGEPRKALREAIKAFRDANRPTDISTPRK